jgi:hypothetical protein
MNIINKIKKHRELRRRQEFLFNGACIWSQKIYFGKANGQFPLLDEFAEVNKQVSDIEDKLPWLYFFLSDIFGFSKSLYIKHIPYDPKADHPEYKLFTYDIVADPGF